MTRRQFMASLGGAAVVLLGSGAVLYGALVARGVSFQASLLRFVLRWFVKARDGQGPTIVELRRGLDSINWVIPGPPKDTKTIELDAGGVRALRVTVPKSRDGYYVIYLHGGGYVLGSASYYRNLLWRIATATQTQVLCINYRLAPEHPFPAALDDAVGAYRWLLASGVDPRRTVIMGDSAGGGLALATLLRLRDNGVVLPAAAVMLSPWTDLAITGRSYRVNAEADAFLAVGQMKYAAQLYLAGADPRTPYASPLYGDPTGLPRSLIQVGGDEIMLDDSVRIAQKMGAAGTYVELQVWPLMPHAWQLFARFLPEGRSAIDKIGAFVQTAFIAAR